MLIAGSLLATGGVAGALFFSCVTAPLAAWSAARLAMAFGAGRRGAWAAGLIVAFLPNSLGLSGRLLTDAVFAHLFVFWVYLLWQWAASGSSRLLISSAAVCIALQSLKPTMSLAAFFILATVVTASKVRERMVAAAVLIVLTVPLPAYFAYRNWKDHGVFATTLLGVRTARDFLMVRALTEDSGLPPAEVLREVQRSDAAAAEILGAPPSYYGRLYGVQALEVERFFRSQPVRAATLMVTEMARQALAPQEFLQQLFWGELTPAKRAVGTLLTLALYAAAAAGAWHLWTQGLRGPALLGILVLLFFLGTGSVSRYVGARLRLPADLVAASLAGVGIEAVSRRRALGR
jgi:hypothetical protein